MGVWEAMCIISLIAGVVLLAMVLSDAIPKPQPKPQDPEAILAERFARGEIDEAEYSRRLSTLTFGPPLEIH